MFKMEKKQIIERAEGIIRSALYELDRLKQEIVEQEEENSAIINRLDKIADDCSAVRKGIIG